MTNQNSSLSTLADAEIPEKWREKYLIKRIGEEDIEISVEVRNGVLKALEAGARFIQIGKYTLMTNAIKSIDPKWGPKNIPPRPRLEERYNDEYDAENRKYIRHVIATNKAEIDLYNKIFGEEKLLSPCTA